MSKGEAVRRIGIDASGGDHGIREVIEGAKIAAAELDLEVTVFGRKEEIAKLVDAPLPRLKIVNCKTSSTELIRALEYLHQGKLNAFVTARKSEELSGACAKYLPDRDLPLKERHLRPCLLAPLPTHFDNHTCYFVDVGATDEVSDPRVYVFWVRCTRDFLIKHRCVKEPRIGLLNNSKEKANDRLTAIARAIVSANIPGFVGYIEPEEMFFSDKLDIALIAGWPGNIGLKLIEGFGKCVLEKAEQRLSGMPQAITVIKRLGQELMTYEAHVVSPFLGPEHMWIFRVHGRAKAPLIAEGIKRAARQYQVEYQF